MKGKKNLKENGLHHRQQTPAENDHPSLPLKSPAVDKYEGTKVGVDKALVVVFHGRDTIAATITAIFGHAIKQQLLGNLTSFEQLLFSSFFFFFLLPFWYNPKRLLYSTAAESGVLLSNLFLHFFQPPPF